MSEIGYSEKLSEEWLEFDYIDAASMENIVGISDGKAEKRDQVAATYNNEDGEYPLQDRAFDKEASLVTKDLDVHVSSEKD